MDLENITQSPQLGALVKFHHAAIEKGHSFEFLFKDDIDYVPEYDAIFIRATTDPQNATYVVSRLAELHGIPVIDDSQSIVICCNKVHLYMILQKHGVPIPETFFLKKEECNMKTAERILHILGRPAVIKAPTTNFSKHVARVNDAKNFIKIARRYFRRSDIIVVQKYIPTDFDWRIGVLNNHVIFGAKYHMVKGFWKIRRTIGGKVFWGEIEALEIDSIPKKVKKVALAATKNVGNGLYGVDLKTVNGNVYVIEVNDNPSIDAGYEDAANPEIYAKIITYLTGR